MLRTLWADPNLRVLEKLDTKHQAIRRHSDTVALVETSEGQVIAHTEFEADPRPAKLTQRMHTYGNLLYGLYDGRFPVRSTVVVLGGRRAVPDFHEVRHGAELLSLYRFRVWRLDRIPAAQLAEDPALAALAPLAPGATLEDLQRAARCVRASWSPTEAADMLGALYIPGSRSYGLELLQRIIREEDIMLSPGYTHIFNKGLERGIQQGVEQGLERGIQQGVEQGVKRGLERGAEQANARARVRLSRQVELRFGASSGVADLLPRCDADDLDHLAELVLLCDSAEALRAALADRLAGR